MLNVIITLLLCYIEIFIPLILFFIWQNRMEEKEIDKTIKLSNEKPPLL